MKKLLPFLFILLSSCNSQTAHHQEDNVNQQSISEKAKHFDGPQALVLVIDQSRSTSDSRELDLILGSVSTIGKFLAPDDGIGIIGFATSPYLALPLAEASKNSPLIEDRLRSLISSGKTNPVPALELAISQLSKFKSTSRQLFLFTDTKIPFSEKLLTLVDKLRAENIRVTVFALAFYGPESAVFDLRELSNRTNGTYFEFSEPLMFFDFVQKQFRALKE